jgi:hypothetical protein
MPIDASIPLQAKLPQFDSPVNGLARLFQIKGLQQQQEMGELQAGELKRGVEENRLLNEAYKGALGPDGVVDRNRLYSTLASKGLGTKIAPIRKGFNEEDAALALKKKNEIEATLKKFEVSGQIMGAVKDQATWDMAREQTREVFGEAAAAQMPAQYDPALVEQKRLQAMPVKDQLEQQWKKLSHDLEVSKFGETKRHNSTTEGLTAQGHAVSVENNKRSVGASYANANATRAAAAETAAATREAAKIKGDRDTEMKLADDYRAQSKPFKEVADAYKIINASLDKATTSPAATLAGATKFMKLLDPGSVVRESELGMALAATGVLDRAANYYKTLQLGKVLTEKQAADFKNIAGQIYKAAQDGQKQVDANYERQANQYGLRKDMIVQDLGQNANAPVDLGALPSGKPRELQWGK